MTDLRYGLIGAGMMGQEHIRNVHLLPGAEIAAIFDPDPPGPNALFLGYFLGSLFAHATLAAAWAALGPGPWKWRIPLSLAWVFTLPIAIAINIAINGGPDEAPFILGCCYFGQWLLLQLPLGGLALVFGIQLRRPADVGQDPTSNQVRFGIRHLLIVMLVTSVVLGIGRAIVPLISIGSREWHIFIFLAVAAIVVTLPLILASLMRRMAILGTLLAIILVGLATAFELPLLQSLGGVGPDAEHFVAINAASSVLILLIVGIVRLNGYCLYSKSAASKPTPVL